MGILVLTGRDGEEIHIIITANIQIIHVIWNGSFSALQTNLGLYHVKEQPREVFSRLREILPAAPSVH